MLKIFQVQTDGDVTYWMALSEGTTEQVIKQMETMYGDFWLESEGPVEKWKITEISSEKAEKILVRNDENDQVTNLLFELQSTVEPKILACTEW